MRLNDIQRQKHINKVRDVPSWPWGTWLPMKRWPDGGGSMQLGGIRAGENDPPVIRDTMARMSGDVADGQELPVLARYESVEAMIDDSWEVD
jgi:hypothetical protein